MKFKEVADTFEAIETLTSRLDIAKTMAQLFTQATPDEAEIIVNLSLGQLRPPYEGTRFNFGEKNLISVIAKLLNKSDHEIAVAGKTMGDLGLVVAAGTWHGAAALSLVSVYQKLVAIEGISGAGAQEEKSALALALLSELDQIAAKYVVRVMLATLRLGFSDMTIVDALSWMEAGDKSRRSVIEHGYNICVDLGLVARTLKKDGIDAIATMQIQVGVPIRPAAAERMPTARAIFQKLGPCVAQPKLDGFRVQIHMKKTERGALVNFFSRNVQNMSAMFPDLVKQVQEMPVRTIICEGEAIAYDEQTGTYLPFQQTVKRKRKHDIEKAAEEYPLRVYLFDLLYLNGSSLLDKTDEYRRDELLSLFKKHQPDSIFVIDEKEIGSADELATYFDENIAAGLEGVVVKKPNAPYQPGKRNFNWIKLKRHEEGHLEDTIDCVVLGYYRGSGKRAAFGIGAILVGVYNAQKDLFQTVAKIGTGFSDEGWKELRQKCDAIAVEKKPVRVECAHELYPDVWVSPELVCMIRADEITRSPVHTANKTHEHLGMALRFPRFMGYRTDKSANDATTVNELKRLYENQ